MLKNKPKILNFILSFCVLVFGFCIPSFTQEQYILQEERDPFIALVTDDGRLLKLETKKPEKIELEGIIYDQQGLSYAVVGGEVVGIGDWIGEYRVYKIYKDKVIFLKQDKEITIELRKEE